MPSTIESRVSALINQDTLDTNQILEIITNVQDALKIKINATEIPTELQFIVVEASVARYRKIGSEGMKQENVDVHIMAFDDSIFLPYESMISEWKVNNNKRAKVKFL